MNRIDLILLTQAFAIPTDMASSSVKENVILTITPTLDGVCGMLLYIILNLVVCSISVPYNEGLSEAFMNLCKRYGIEVHFKSGKTIKDELVAPKDKDHITKKSGVIYRYSSDMLECDEEYIGETARTFRERFKEHLKAPSPIHDHSNITGHSTTINNFSTVGREEHGLSRLIKESMYIRVNNPFLNKKHR